MPASRLTLCLPDAAAQVQKVTIAPHQKLPLGHMVLDLNEGRELTGLFTRRYLLQQLRLVLAGERAAMCTHPVAAQPYVTSCVGIAVIWTASALMR